MTNTPQFFGACEIISDTDAYENIPNNAIGCQFKASVVLSALGVNDSRAYLIITC